MIILVFYLLLLLFFYTICLFGLIKDEDRRTFLIKL